MQPVLQQKLIEIFPGNKTLIQIPQGQLLFNLIYQIDHDLKASSAVTLHFSSNESLEIKMRGKGRLIRNFMNLKQNITVEKIEFSSPDLVSFYFGLST